MCASTRVAGSRSAGASAAQRARMPRASEALKDVSQTSFSYFPPRIVVIPDGVPGAGRGMMYVALPSSELPVPRVGGRRGKER